MAGSKLYEKIYEIVRQIPVAQVATYGQIATLVKVPRGARQVGYALHALTAEDDVPWHRVINSKGEISRRGELGYEERQRELLEAEGVQFDERGRIDLSLFQWSSEEST